jgi:hypothetical protein
MSKQIVFADRIMGAFIQNGTVRLDLAVLEPVAQKEGKTSVRATATHQLVMPLAAFVEGVRMQQQLLQELAKQQAQQRGDTGTPEAEVAAPAI